MVDREHLDAVWKNEPADKAGAHAAGEKLRSDTGQEKAGAVQAFYENARAGLVAPVEALGELCDHAAGTHTADFLAEVAGKPKETNSDVAWACAQIGTAVGMTPWLWMLHKSGSAAVLSMSEGETLTAFQRLSVSGASGMAYGLALTPTGSGDHHWARSRWQNGLAASFSFAALTGSSEALGAAGVSNRALAGALSGVPAGLADAGTRYATGQSKTFKPMETVGTYSFLGGAFGLVSPFGKAPEAKAELRNATEGKADMRSLVPEKVQPFETLSPKMQVLTAINNTPVDYLSRTIETRTPEHRAGSYFDMNAEQLRQKLIEADWQPYNPLDASGKPVITGGARAYRATISGGRLGITPVADIPESASLYLIDPKGINKWSVSTVGASEPHTDHVTLIVGPDEGAAASPIVWTFHPGEPIAPSALDTSVLEGMMKQMGLSAKELPTSGTGRRIAVTRAQLGTINAGLPEGATLDLAKIESESNLNSK